MAEAAVRIDLGAGVARLVGRAVMLMGMMAEMRRLWRFLLMLTIAGRRGKRGVERKQDHKKVGEAGAHGGGVYQRA